MGPVDLLLLLGIGICVLCEGFFSGSELALVAADRGKLRRRSAEGDRRARRALALLQSSDRLLTVTLLGTSLSVVSGAMLCNELFARTLSPALAPYSALVMVPLVLALGEVLPKAVMRPRADVLAPFVSGPLLVIKTALAPLVALLPLSVRPITAALRALAHAPRLPEMTREELQLLVKTTEVRGMAPAEEGEVIHRLLQMSDRRVREVMVPVADVVSADQSTPAREIARLSRDLGFSRIFIHEGGTGNIRGFVHAMDLLTADADAPDVSKIVRNAHYVPELGQLPDVLREMLGERVEVAVVVDEYGATTGIVSLEDLIEVIVGQISDEFDRPRGPQVEEQAGGKLVVDARLALSELRRRGVRLHDEEDERASTVSGLLMEVAQRVPQQGDAFRVGNARFQVLSASDRRVRRVLVEIEPDRPAVD